MNISILDACCMLLAFLTCVLSSYIQISPESKLDCVLAPNLYQQLHSANVAPFVCSTLLKKKPIILSTHTQPKAYSLPVERLVCSVISHPISNEAIHYMQASFLAQLNMFFYAPVQSGYSINANKGLSTLRNCARYASGPSPLLDCHMCLPMGVSCVVALEMPARVQIMHPW
eukprot:scaffold282414_cov19-Tisochrysis_lutea.AAC.3